MQAANPFRNNPLLNAGARSNDRPRRLPWAVSILFHVLFVIGLLVLPGRFARQEAEPKSIDIVFFKPEIDRPAPPPPPVAEPLPEPEPVPVIESPEPITLAEVIPPPTREPAPTPVLPRNDPPPPPPPKPKATPLPKPERVIVRALPDPEPPKRSEPPKPRPITGAFAEAKPEPRPAIRPERVVANVGSFGAEPLPKPVHAAPVRENRVVAAGSFGGGAVEVPREPAERRSTVTRTDFTAEVADQPAPRRGTVTPTNFNAEVVDRPAPRETERSVVVAAAFNAQDQGEPQPTGQPRSVNQGGFGAVENTAVPSSKRSLPSEDLDTPVEIVSKPKPVYTDEARQLRIEGEVVLEVTFADNGELQVLRVVDGLGHGLDEAAIAAAKKVQFTPARRDGRPVDHTATLRVVFRLA